MSNFIEDCPNELGCLVAAKKEYILTRFGEIQVAYHVKGNQLQMLFDKADTKAFLSSIFSMDLVAFRAVAESTNDKIVITNTDQAQLYEVGHFWIVPKDKTEIATWKKVQLKTGENFHFDNLNSKAVQFISCECSEKRIGLGRISVSTEWQDDTGKRVVATYEKNVYKTLQKLIKNQSEGKIGTIYVGKMANSKWQANEVELCYTANENGMCFSKKASKGYKEQFH